MTGTPLTERGFIEQLRRMLPATGESLVRGVGDDCAVFRMAEGILGLLTTDTMVEGVHFDRSWHPPRLLGRKLAAVNLSDVAAMGGEPRFAVLSVAVPDALMNDWLQEVMAGLGGMLSEHGAILIGGDTVKCHGSAVFSLTLLGAVDEAEVCYRSGARPGDSVWISGEPGLAAAGLALCKNGQGQDGRWSRLVEAHLNPEPMLRLGRLLAESGVITAMIDTSDGMATDLAHLCKESGVAAEIDAERIRLSPLQQEAVRFCAVDPLKWALAGGEDFLLLFTVPIEREKGVEEIVSKQGFGSMHRVGTIVEGQGVFLKKSGTREDISYRGYDHFVGTS